METTRIFVYGTLRKGFDLPLANHLAEHSEYLGKGTIPGLLFDIQGQYPGVLAIEHFPYKVTGDVYDLFVPVVVLARLDEYEGIGVGFPQPEEYVRRVVSVKMEKGTLPCWAYLYNHGLAEAEWIPSGDYLGGGGC